MKCIILAGGSGDALWPLSRKNYPKQFMYIREGRSLFQEAIARNLPFCDEFFIITNEKYKHIAFGQLQVFQGLKFQCFLEQRGRQTGPAVAIACMCAPKEEPILVISTDHMISDGDYNGTILKAKSLLKPTNIVVVGCKMEAEHPHYNQGHNYFLHDESVVTGFIEQGIVHADNAMIDSGIFLMYADTYLSAVKENTPDLYETCVSSKGRLVPNQDWIVVPEEFLEKLTPVSVGQAVFREWASKGRLSIVEADFAWSRLLSLEVFAEFTNSGEGPAILENSKNVSIVNEEKNSLVVGNELEDLVIINTKDAVYISKKGESAKIKDIMFRHYREEKSIFDEGDIFYTTWGIKETLTRHNHFMVKMLTIFPGRIIGSHKHEKRSEHWSVVSGTATILMQGRELEYSANESIYVPQGSFHQIMNKTAKDLILIEVSIGESAALPTSDMVTQTDEILKLMPVYKDYLWGGNRLRDLFAKEWDKDIIAESWELSTHPAGESRIAEGKHAGMALSQYIKKNGKEILGWKCQPFEMFPLLIKFIDAKKRLSIQVHPDDGYAMQVEGEYGKNEMWYILDAEEGAFVYLGFEKDITEEECKKRIEDGTLEEALHKVKVKKGDVIFVEAGTIHAINDGILVLEIQQSSNATYRLYDYNRIDKNGLKRELHLEKAFANINLSKSTLKAGTGGEVEVLKNYKKQVLGQCKYFMSVLYIVEKEAEIHFDDSSFGAIVFLSGKGVLGCKGQFLSFNQGDTFFIAAGKKVLSVIGDAKFVLNTI